MNTSHGNAVLPNSRRQAVAIAALKRARTLAVLIALGAVDAIVLESYGEPASRTET